MKPLHTPETAGTNRQATQRRIPEKRKTSTAPLRKPTILKVTFLFHFAALLVMLAFIRRLLFQFTAF
jgi:hypothetical protein